MEAHQLGTAINEIGDGMMKSAKKADQIQVYWLGSAKHNNEQAYLFRKFAAYWGTNNVDHQARICHSTTVAVLPIHGATAP